MRLLMTIADLTPSDSTRYYVTDPVTGTWTNWCVDKSTALSRPLTSPLTGTFTSVDTFVKHHKKYGIIEVDRFTLQSHPEYFI